MVPEASYGGRPDTITDWSTGSNSTEMDGKVTADAFILMVHSYVCLEKFREYEYNE